MLTWTDKYDLPDCELELRKGWLTQDEADALFEELVRDVEWETKKLWMFGKWIDQPRLTAFYGDAGKKYHYTGSDWQAKQWLPGMEMVRDRIKSEYGMEMNSVLCNHYRNGSDSVGWHTDGGGADGLNPQIFSLSLGAARDFQIKHNTLASHSLRTIKLGHGSLLYMGGTMQSHWKHQVPKVVSSGPRINLTFRAVVG